MTNGKGDMDRTTDRKRYEDNYAYWKRNSKKKETHGKATVHAPKQDQERAT